MAEYYANAKRAAGGLAESARQGKAITYNQTFEKATGDGDGSIIRLFTIPSNAIILPTGGYLACDAITGLTSASLGFYQPGIGGAAISASCLLSGQTLASASKALNPVGSVDIADLGKPAWQIAGLSKDPGGVFDVAMTLNTAGSAAGTVTVALHTGGPT